MNDLSPTEQAALPDLTNVKQPLERAALAKLTYQGDAFLPFGGTVTSAGESMEYETGKQAAGEALKPEIVYQMLVQGMNGATRHGQIRAAGICHGTLLKEGGRPALRLVVEHANGAAFEVLVPFHKDAEGNYVLEQETVTRSRPIIFAAPAQ